MEQFIEYVSRYKSDFRSCIRGASREEIVRLEKVSKQILPDFYKTFLYHMGHETCGIEIAQDGSAINDIIQYYEESIRTGYATLPATCILIGLGDAKTCLEMKEGEEQRVILTDDEDILGLVAESLKKLLFQEAFVVYRSKEFPYDAFYSSSFESIGKKHRVAEARKIALSLGFEEQWFSDTNTFCGEKGGSCIYINQLEKLGLAIAIRSSNLEALSEMGKPFMKVMGVDLVL